MKERVEVQESAKTGWLIEAFAEQAKTHAQHRELNALKQKAFTAFLERGLPTRKDEDWKYNDLSFLEKQAYAFVPATATPLSPELSALLASRAAEANLMVFINGHFAAEHSSLESLPEGAMICSLEQALHKNANLLAPYLLRDMDQQRQPFAALNTALFTQGVFVYLPKHAELSKPLHLLSLATDKNPFMMQPRHLVVMEQNSRLVLTEECLGFGADHYFVNSVNDFYVGREAHLTYYKLQNEAANAKHLATLFLHQKQNSYVKASSFALGSQFARQECWVALREHHAQCHLDGFYGTDANQQVLDHHLFVDHIAQHTQSDMNFRGVLDKQSRAIFNGKVKVWPNAQETVAKQLNHNILLSNQAEVYSKPDLEIYADAVQCRHGATVGQLDEEALFYLQARGIKREEARVILLQAFMDSILSEVKSPWLVQELKGLWANHLRGEA